MPGDGLSKFAECDPPVLLDERVMGINDVYLSMADIDTRGDPQHHVYQVRSLLLIVLRWSSVYQVLFFFNFSLILLFPRTVSALNLSALRSTYSSKHETTRRPSFSMATGSARAVSKSNSKAFLGFLTDIDFILGAQ